MTSIKEKEVLVSQVTPPKAGRREWIGLAILMLPTLLIVMDLTVLHLAVPHLSADLQPSSTQLLWIVDIYGFMIAGSLVTMGTLGDRIGRRKLLLMGAVTVAGQLPHQVGTALLGAAYQAFIQGLQLTAIIGVVVMIGLAILTLVMLRQVHPPSEPEIQPDPKRDGWVTFGAGAE